MQVDRAIDRFEPHLPPAPTERPFEIVAQESARALLELSVARRLPIGNGILTVETNAQAWTRARADEADKGGDAARATLSLVRLKRRLAEA